MFEVAYSIDGELKEVYFSMKEDALKFYDDILKYFDPKVKTLEKEFLGYQLIKEV